MRGEWGEFVLNYAPGSKEDPTEEGGIESVGILESSHLEENESLTLQHQAGVTERSVTTHHAEVGWEDPRDKEVGPGDRLGHRVRQLRPELSAEKPRGKQSKAKGMDILNGLSLADYNTWTMNLALNFLAA